MVKHRFLRKVILCIPFLLGLLIPYTFFAATYYVSPDGIGSGTSLSDPASIYDITEVAKPGDIVNILAGVYDNPEPIILKRSGTKEAPITWQSYNGEVIFDGIKRDVNLDNPYLEKCQVQLYYCNWQVLRGFTVKNAPGHGIGDFGSSSNHNVYERIIAEDNYGNGIMVRGDYNTLIDCIARYNYDYAGDASTGSKPGDNGDGISPDGRHNTLIRCISHHNSDDGYDCWYGEHGMFINCIAFANGSNEGCRNRDHGTWEIEDGFAGGGTGFKFGIGGGSSLDKDCQAFNTAIRCIAYDNLSAGFTTNKGGGNIYINCTAYNNNTEDGGEKDFNAYEYVDNFGTKTNIFINNLVLNERTKPIKMNGDYLIRENNSWDIWFQDTYDVAKLLEAVSPDDFKSLIRPGENYTYDQFKASDFLKLKTDSKCIDQGEDPEEAIQRIVRTEGRIIEYDPDTDLGVEVDEILDILSDYSHYNDNYDLGAFETLAPEATGVPGEPTDVTATAGDGEATVSFTAPISDGGSPITSYIVTSVPGNITATGAGTSIKVEGLTNGISYKFTVKAVNVVGEGPESELSNEVIPTATEEEEPEPEPGPLTAPTNVTATAGDREATVKFRAPTSNGRSQIIKYIVTSVPENITAIGTGTTITVRGLTNGVSYRFKVKAINADGEEEESELSNRVTPYRKTDEGNSNSGNSGSGSSGSGNSGSSTSDSGNSKSDSDKSTSEQKDTTEKKNTDSKKHILLTLNSEDAFINNQVYKYSLAPFVDQATGRTMVPLRFISEALGAEVTWLSETKQIVIKDEGVEIYLTVGSNVVVYNGNIITIDSSPMIQPPGYTFVPLRFISEVLGAQVDYNSESKQITIVK